MRYQALASILILCGGLGSLFAQTTPPSPTKRSTKSSAANPSQQNKHYPILVIAHGNEPSWSLRLGMKGPERLDRLNYPPIALESGEITAEEDGNSWSYAAKDLATGAAVTVLLTREPCSDKMSDTKYTFSVVVDHAQIGKLNGCGISAPDKFPEFLKKNQPLDPAQNDAASKEKEKSVFDPITHYQNPVAVAYIDPAGKVVVAHGEMKKTAAASGQEPALSHDGKRLLYTRSDSKSGPERSLVLFEFDTGHSRDFATGNVRQAFWSPDDSRVAFLKSDNQKWYVWVAAAASPQNATQFSHQEVLSLHGWASADTLLATDTQNAYWIGADGQLKQSVPLSKIYGDGFQIMSSDTLRLSPINPDLLLVSAYRQNAPTQAPVDAMGLNSTFFLYEIRSQRRTELGPADAFARSGEWSRDSLLIFFSRMQSAKSFVTDRMFWDATGVKRYVLGSDLVVGR